MRHKASRVSLGMKKDEKASKYSSRSQNNPQNLSLYFHELEIFP